MVLKKNLLKGQCPQQKLLRVQSTWRWGLKTNKRSIKTWIPTLNRYRSVTISKNAIATRITSSNENTSHATQLFPKTTNTLAFVLIVVSVGAINNVKFDPQTVKAITVELRDILKVANPKVTGPNVKPQQTNVNQIDATTTKNDDEESNCINIYQQFYNQVYDSNYDSNSDDHVAAMSSDSPNQLEPLKTGSQYEKIVANPRIGSGSVCSIILKTLAYRFLNSTPYARWITTNMMKISKHSLTNW